MKKNLDSYFMIIGLLGLLLMPILALISDIGHSDLEMGTATLIALLVLFFALFIAGYIGGKINKNN